MPIIKSAKKRMRQNVKRRMQRLPFRTRLKTEVKKVLDTCKAGNLEEAKKLLSVAYSVIDTSCKKNIIHKNTAARKKSQLALAIAELEKKGA